MPDFSLKSPHAGSVIPSLFSLFMPSLCSQLDEPMMIIDDLLCFPFNIGYKKFCLEIVMYSCLRWGSTYLFFSLPFSWKWTTALLVTCLTTRSDKPQWHIISGFPEVNTVSMVLFSPLQVSKGAHFCVSVLCVEFRPGSAADSSMQWYEREKKAPRDYEVWLFCGLWFCDVNVLYHSFEQILWVEKHFYFRDPNKLPGLLSSAPKPGRNSAHRTHLRVSQCWCTIALMTGMPYRFMCKTPNYSFKQRYLVCMQMDT